LSGAVDEVRDTAPLAVPALSGADLAVNLHGRGPESHRAVLASAPRRMIAFAAPDVPWGGPEWRPHEHEVVRWCRLLEESGVPADPRDLRLPPPAISPPPEARGATLIHPGAASAARRWPPERWAEVARAERAAGRDVVVTGSAAERELAERVADGAGLPETAVLAGRTELAGLAAAVAAAGRVASGDTGVAHLATAFGVPSVVLFGPTPPAEWGPPAGDPRHVVLWAGRRGDPHATAPDPGLLELRPAAVISALEALPAAPSGRLAA
jgi:ADP-heptose:LPS heptosyltransferase